DHPGRRRAHSEQSALALGDDLERHGLPREPGKAPFELAKRHPLRLADRLADRFDDWILVRHRREPFFFLRLTLRGWPGRSAWAFGCSAAAPLASPPSSGAGAGASRRGVRDERCGGAAGFGINRRVISPWPTVHRLVVTQ